MLAKPINKTEDIRVKESQRKTRKRRTCMHIGSLFEWYPMAQRSKTNQKPKTLFRPTHTPQVLFFLFAQVFVGKYFSLPTLACRQCLSTLVLPTWGNMQNRQRERKRKRTEKRQDEGREKRQCRERKGTSMCFGLMLG